MAATIEVLGGSSHQALLISAQRPQVNGFAILLPQHGVQRIHVIAQHKTEGAAGTRHPRRFSVIVDGQSRADRISSHGSQFLYRVIPPEDRLVLVILV